MTSRLRERYHESVVPALTKEFGYGNVMAVPRIQRIVVNMGLGEATQNVKLIDAGSDDLTRITGQKPLTTRARKSIAQFKLRQGMPIGSVVTLRRDRMYEFLDRLISIALPRVRDFRGVSPKGFDGRGNYTLGLPDQLMFIEIDYMKVDKSRGMNISVVTTARTDEEGRRLLELMGRPFRTNGLERPVARLLFAPLRPRITVSYASLHLCAGPRRSLADPTREGFDFTVWQFSRRGHLDRALVANSR